MGCSGGGVGGGGGERKSVRSPSSVAGSQKYAIIGTILLQRWGFCNDFVGMVEVEWEEVGGMGGRW